MDSSNQTLLDLDISQQYEDLNTRYLVPEGFVESFYEEMPATPPEQDITSLSGLSEANYTAPSPYIDITGIDSTTIEPPNTLQPPMSPPPTIAASARSPLPGIATPAVVPQHPAMLQHPVNPPAIIQHPVNHPPEIALPQQPVNLPPAMAQHSLNQWHPAQYQWPYGYNQYASEYLTQAAQFPW